MSGLETIRLIRQYHAAANIVLLTMLTPREIEVLDRVKLEEALSASSNLR